VAYLRPTAIASLIAALALLLAGCGGGTDVDYTKASETIKASLESPKEGFGVRVDKVECPSGVAADPGTHFECLVEFPGGKIAYADVRIRDTKADLSVESLNSDHRS
jgi:hypothetical protein